MNFKLLSVVALAACLVSPLLAADPAKPAKKVKGQHGANPATALLKQLAELNLTDEQRTKITELGVTVATQMKTIREQSGVTDEVSKKIAEAQKSLKNSDKKGKERAKAVHEAAGLTAEQIAGLVELDNTRKKFQQDAIAVLTDEQKQKLPANLTRGANKKPAKPKKNAA